MPHVVRQREGQGYDDCKQGDEGAAAACEEAEEGAGCGVAARLHERHEDVSDENEEADGGAEAGQEVDCGFDFLGAGAEHEADDVFVGNAAGLGGMICCVVGGGD